MATSSEIYKVTFLNKGKVYELFVRQVFQSDLYGFIEVEDYVFDEVTQVVVDPSEEKLKNEFAGVRRSFIPIQSVIRIDEVEKGGVSKISSGDNITPLPVSYIGGKTDHVKSD
ncbi:MAG: DUF1820 family protein [Gammaproteobacteria bacterium]|nr:DUF1820 family protein [Gammaproteobacteria bacterium]MDE0478401.1 DUF1820 family protein [Gammaproteobacteria bacterium]MDE0507407.1 DUF1820 family protein [Gammaproteobacteria bacterium]MXX05763.1 DUF1820 family protein [Gammaproteobacteria bacterium]MXY90647.1 DUF1820 family protein [Gammaproteobacteria bacterium]